MGWQFLGIIAIVCAVLCAVGFYKFVYFLSVGYGLAIAGGSIAVFVIALTNGWLTGIALPIAIAQMILFIIYGMRLSGFLIIREVKNIAYRKTLKEATGGDKKMPVFVKAVIWIFVTVLYTAQLSPMFYRHMNGMKDVVVPVIGMIISVIGLILEATADSQKSAQKKINPDMVATKGLYKMVRCPNYLGEIIFWTGVFVAGITGYHSAGQWIMAVIAYIAIVYIMFNGAQRLEKRQNGRYGDKKEYVDYANSTPIIIPLIPLYHLIKTDKK